MKRWVLSIWSGVDQFWFKPVDARIYAWIRIGFAVVALINLADLWQDRHSFFADTGILDLATARANAADQPLFSIFFWISSESAVTAVFLVTALALACLGLGIFPRVTAIWAYVWHVSIVNRAFPIIHGWDMVLRIFSFFIMISPIGNALRLRWNKHRSAEPKSLPNTEDESSLEMLPRYGLVLFQIQLAVIYWQTVWLKLSDQFWRNGEFISYYMMSMYTRFPDSAWADRLLISNVLTYGTLIAEISIPLLLFFKRTRVLGFVVGWGLHLGILAMSNLVVFSLIMLVPYLAFLDNDDIQRIRRFLFGKTGRIEQDHP